jgi:alpha-beta hydrolase superfamily lysophospholipase
MKTQKEDFTASDGARIVLHSWLPEEKPAAVMLIIHGMVEHAARFDHTARAFVARGIAVYAHDQRGHGETAGTLDNAGYICPGDGFGRVVLDAHEIILMLKQRYPGGKFFLLGHSFGSFVAQCFIEDYGAEIDGCILSGTAGPRQGFIGIANFAARCVAAVKGEKHRSKLLNDLSFGSYNKRIENPQSALAWLSRDSEVVKKHDADPWCNFMPTAAFTVNLTSGLLRIHRKEAMAAIPKGLPVLLFSGDADPVGDYGVTVKALADIYRKNGMTDVTLNIYSGGRHEMLNEINKDEVIGDTLAWIDKRERLYGE